MTPDGTSKQEEKLLSAAETMEEWRAVTDLYTDFLEIWSVGEDGELQSLIAEIPIDPGENAGHNHARAHLIASAPAQFRTLQKAPKPPACAEPAANRGELEALMLTWIKLEYRPWYEFQRSQALAKAGGKASSISIPQETPFTKEATP